MVSANRWYDMIESSSVKWHLIIYREKFPVNEGMGTFVQYNRKCKHFTYQVGHYLNLLGLESWIYRKGHNRPETPDFITFDFCLQGLLKVGLYTPHVKTKDKLVVLITISTALIEERQAFHITGAHYVAEEIRTNKALEKFMKCNFQLNHVSLLGIV